MTLIIPTDIIDQLIRDEGEVLHVYLDSKEIRTGGVGHNLEAHGIDWPVGTPITKEQSRLWLTQDMESVNHDLHASLPFVWDLNVPRRGVFQNMCFNLGINRLMGFSNTIGAAKIKDYELCASEMLRSKWARDVGVRANRLAEQMRTGEWR